MAGRAPGLLGALALLAALAILAPPASGQGLTADLSADSLALGGQPRVNQTVGVQVVVTNHGPADVATFDVAFALDNLSVPLNGSASKLSYPTDGSSFQIVGSCTGMIVGVTPLKANCTLQGTFNWTPVPAQAGAHAALAMTEVTGYTDPDGTNNVTRADAFVERHELHLKLAPTDEAGRKVKPGETAFYRVALQNRGNVREAVALDATADAWADAAAVSACGSGSCSVVVPAGQDAPFLVFLSPTASDVAANATSRARVTAENASAPGSPVRLDLPNTTGDPSLATSYGFRAAGAQDVQVEAGGSTDPGLAGTNTASTADALGLQLSGGGPGWNLTLPNGSWVGLDAGSGSTVALAVRAEADSHLGPGQNVTATLTVTSKNQPSARAVLPLVFRVAAPDLAVASLRLDHDPLYAGDNVGAVVDVRNVGGKPLPKPVRIALALERNGSALPLADEVVGDMNPGDDRLVSLRFDATGLAGAYDLVATADADHDVAELREDNNDLRMGVSFRQAGLALAAPPDRDARPGDALAYTGAGAFTLANTGSDPEAVRVTLATPHGWIQDTRILALVPGAPQALAITLQVPARPGTLAEPLQVHAELLNRSATAQDNRTLVRIVDDQPPELAAVDAPDFAELGTAQAISATLVDATGVRNATLHLREPDGRLRDLPMNPQDNDTWRAAVVFAQAGGVSFWFTATDATPANNTLDTSGSPRSLTVGVHAAPLVELLDPQPGAVVRSGTLLRLRISDVHGIAAANYTEGPRTADLPAPYAIGTAGWDEGPHVLNVTATNRFGNPGSLVFTITIDDTPPLIREGTASPAHPKPGEEIVVRAQASADAVRAEVQVLQGGKLLREQPASLVGQVASANLTLDAGRYVLSLRVEDQAGNAATVDVPVEVGAGLPGFDALPAMAALAAALAARRSIGPPRIGAGRCSADRPSTTARATSRAPRWALLPSRAGSEAAPPPQTGCSGERLNT